jgi:glycogen operon protein
MMLMGDEARRTQGGNNNAYCQDNETSWFDWTLLAKRADVHRFVTLLNARRVLRDVEPERQGVTLDQLIRQADITWHGVKLHEPDWRHSSHSVAFTARFTAERMFFHVILSAYWEPLEFELPLLASGARDPWRRWIDTFLDSPHDIVDWEQAPSVPDPAYRTEPRSVVVLFAGLDPES